MGSKIKRIVPAWLWHIILITYNMPLTLAKVLCSKCPIKRKIVFCNFCGRGFGDNPRYIAEEIIRRGLDYELVWLVKDLTAIMPEGIRKVKYNSFKSVYELSTAGIIISNVKNLLPYKKKKTQYYIQTGHGELPMKYIEGECEESLDPEYLRESKADSAIIDLHLSGCSIDTHIFRNYFWYSGEIMEKGIPRNDMLFRSTAKQRNDIRNQIGIPAGYKAAMYAPTFRGTGEIDAYNLDAELLIDCLERKTHENWVIIIRMHPNAKKFTNKYLYGEKIINGSVVSDPQILVLASDLLVTDYSSIMVDFMISKKPVLLYTPDLEEYKKDRGLRDIYYELPLVNASTNHDLGNEILHLNMYEYIAKIDRFVKERIRSFDNGHASEHVVERIEQVMKNVSFK